MICFGFSCSRDGLSIELCEEVIQYHTNREEGIPLAANLIVKSTSDEAKYLGAWHRGDVSPFCIEETERWIERDDFYTNIFFNIAKNRGKVGPERTIEVRLFDDQKMEDPCLRPETETTGGVAVPCIGDSRNGVSVSYPVHDRLGSDSEVADVLRPYTYGIIGPFSGRDRYFAIRITAHIGEHVFEKFATENICEGTRFYEVYGVDEILQRIGALDLPELQDRCASGISYEVYQDEFVSGLLRRKLVPEFYSVVAIDSPDSKNYPLNGLFTIQLRRGLKDLTDQIHEGLYEHESLANLKDRVFWFVTREKDRDFRLQLEGPMAEAFSCESRARARR